MEKVTILLSAYNGEKYLPEQLSSLFAQKDVKVNILIRDDGSTDTTRQLLDEYQSKGLISWYFGENLRPAKSFMDLVYRAPDSEYYAFCDQDDFWLEDKLKIAVEKLKQFPADKPALYYGRPRLTDAELNPIENPASSLDRMLDYKSALINSNATGCTMVFNRALLEKVREKKPDYIAMHDAWFHKVCIVTGGNLYFDEDVHILYRQHGNNVIGISNSKKARLKKHYRSFRSKECSRSRLICSLLECYGDQMSEEDRYLSELVADYHRGVVPKMKLMLNRSIGTDYKRRNRLFRLAIALGIF